MKELETDSSPGFLAIQYTGKNRTGIRRFVHMIQHFAFGYTDCKVQQLKYGEVWAGLEVRGMFEREMLQLTTKKKKSPLDIPPILYKGDWLVFEQRHFRLEALRNEEFEKHFTKEIE